MKIYIILVLFIINLPLNSINIQVEPTGIYSMIDVENDHRQVGFN